MVIDIWAILIAIVAFGLYASFYKWNPLSQVIQCMILGAALAMFTVQYTNSFISVTWTPFITKFSANWLNIGAIILGICYFTYFIPKLRKVYRNVLLLNLATSLGVTAPIVFSMIVSWITGYAKGAFTSIGGFAAMVALALSMMNFLFSAMLDKPFKIPRTLGRYVIYIMMATIMTMCFVSNSNMLMYNSIAVWNSTAWWVPVLIFVVILVDVFGGLNPIKQRLKQAKVEPAK